jgi:hypothetical protein
VTLLPNPGVSIDFTQTLFEMNRIVLHALSGSYPRFSVSEQCEEPRPFFVPKERDFVHSGDRAMLLLAA